jgi:hypothetical protein
MAINGESERKSRWRMAYRALITLIEHRGEMEAYRDHLRRSIYENQWRNRKRGWRRRRCVKAKSINISGENGG